MGLGIYPHRKFSPFGGATGDRRMMTLPGLSQFYFAGTWATNAGALFLNALSGRRVVQAICRSDGRKFVSR